MTSEEGVSVARASVWGSALRMHNAIIDEYFDPSGARTLVIVADDELRKFNHGSHEMHEKKRKNNYGTVGKRAVRAWHFSLFSYFV